MFLVALTAVTVVLAVLAMRKKKTIAQRVEALEEKLNTGAFAEFAKCWESNFIGLGVVFRMEKTFIQVVTNHNETVVACDVAKQKISSMVEQISALTDENIDLRKSHDVHKELIHRTQRQATRITELEEAGELALRMQDAILSAMEELKRAL